MNISLAVSSKKPAWPGALVHLRADAGHKTGLGHVSRMAALSEILERDGFECVWVAVAPQMDVLGRFKQSFSCVLKLSDQDIRHWKTHLTQSVIAVLDGYQFDKTFENEVRDSAGRLVIVDDLADRVREADLIINQAGGLDATHYPAAPGARLCLGPGFALLRPDFLKPRIVREASAVGSRPYKVLLSMGGADPSDFTGKLISEITTSPHVGTIHVVLGTLYSHESKLRLEAASQKIVFHRDLSASQLRDLMAECELAVLPASTMSMEYASVGGGLFLKQTAENQSGFFRFFTSEGLAKPVEEWGHFQNNGQIANFIADCDRNQSIHFDGRSGQRLLGEFRSLYWSRALRLRPVEKDDSRLLFDWANDPETRQNAFQSSQIPWVDHEHWFQSNLGSNKTRIFIALIENTPIGQIRFDLRENKGWEIDFSISSPWRGRGLGSQVLKLGAEVMTQITRAQRLFGVVKSNNQASSKAFLSAGFESSDLISGTGTVAFHFPRTPKK
ncbi:MAG: UDP-2,4-diacetamido-2,4,6-trideoxy-beta-L-altropyranose hydrolase [Spirochaetia bacterium]|nr:UDP-2,4-diacetamido-2,4,6-trideoxy-beta-L-altropyranose hydrolase [Spirochaetia bacterium]